MLSVTVSSTSQLGASNLLVLFSVPIYHTLAANWPSWSIHLPRILSNFMGSLRRHANGGHQGAFAKLWSVLSEIQVSKYANGLTVVVQVNGSIYSYHNGNL
jgi:hypothetical protein